MRNVAVLMGVALALNGCGKPDMGDFTPGVADACHAMPGFIRNTGLGGQVAIDTQQRGYTGIRLLNAQTGQSWSHPSWDDAGHVGAFVRDRDGNIYIAPTPEVSLAENPPALQNRIYRIDAQSGEMALWLELPSAAPPSPANPFGVMGLFYDCDTNSLYATSLAGSKPGQALGRVYRIDVARQQVVGQLENTDAIGVGVFNGVQHKRLYWGSARSSDVYSVALDANGDFTSDVRHEFALATLSGGNTTSVRKIEFGKDRQGQYLLQAKEVEFGFRLMAENNLHRRIYLFRYGPADDKWSFMDSIPEQ
ncbi:hypothetical protein VSS37_02990 [Candidatus Thiothrix sp. Deng01]|uniref:Phytase-like domain-containing protein n=1 Tax=Candidatus Thiothrix phosphatis TaxID=3112415 RepID=A0ABU6CT47_9GAMM|nr:hypothetical protein [Candidatus Thiothrix sp. Deng01]MEB4589934.1 hypothetical protein [Candidatus Thiothrix sp. Deng01]